MKTILLLLSLLVATTAIYARQAVKGKIYDAVTREPLSGATVTDAHNHIVAADVTGSFNLTTEDTSITVSFTGYQSQIILVNNRGIINIAMQPVNKGLAQVV